MIEWPTEPEEGAEKALERFKKTSMAAELEDDARTWTFISWARKPDPPARMILRSDTGDHAEFTLEASGHWMKG